MPYNSSQVVAALSQFLEDNGKARYEPTGAYPTGTAPAVFMGRLPATPDSVVLINVYDWQRGRDDHNPDVYVQLRYRTAGKDPRTTENQADSVDALLHDRTEYVMPGGVRVLLSRATLRGLIEPDDNGRYERADSFRFTLTPNG